MVARGFTASFNILVSRHVTRACRILPFQYKVIFVSVSFSTSSSVGFFLRAKTDDTVIQDTRKAAQCVVHIETATL